MFQGYLKAHPLMAKFVTMSASENLFPYPQVPGAMYFQRTVNEAAEKAINNPHLSAAEILRQTQMQVQAHLVREKRGQDSFSNSTAAPESDEHENESRFPSTRLHSDRVEGAK